MLREVTFPAATSLLNLVQGFGIIYNDLFIILSKEYMTWFRNDFNFTFHSLETYIFWHEAYTTYKWIFNLTITKWKSHEASWLVISTLCDNPGPWWQNNTKPNYILRQASRQRAVVIKREDFFPSKNIYLVYAYIKRHFYYDFTHRLKRAIIFYASFI